MSDSLQQEAIQWLLRLRDAPDDAAAQAAFDRWLALGDPQRMAYLDALMAENALGTAWAEPAPLRSQPAERRAWRGFALLTGSCAVLLAIAFGPRWQANLRADETSAAGRYREVVLADGSQLRLAPDSAVRIDFTAQQRVIELLRGELTVRVHDDARALSVRHDDFVVVDIGTTFTVSEARGALRVAVADGSVEVARHGSGEAAFKLAAGEQAEWEGRGVRRWPYRDTGDARGDLLVLDAASAGRALEQWSRASGRRVVILTRSTDAPPLSAALPMSSAAEQQQALDTICRHFDCEIAGQAAGVVLLRASK